MTSWKQRDNGGLREKLRLRREAMARAGDEPTVLETHAGEGVLGSRLYGSLDGIAIEKDEAKAAKVSAARPRWRVYEGDSIAALSSGLAADVPIAFVDIDPYGDPWPTVRSFLGFPRQQVERLVVAVNDGLRRGLKIGAGWRYGSLAEAVLHFGSDLYDQYLAVARWMLGREAARSGYALREFRGFYGGQGQGMSHYYGVLEPDASLGTDYLEKPISGCRSCHSKKTASDPATLPYTAERRRKAS